MMESEEKGFVKPYHFDNREQESQLVKILSRFGCIIPVVRGPGKVEIKSRNCNGKKENYHVIQIGMAEKGHYHVYRKNKFVGDLSTRTSPFISEPNISGILKIFCEELISIIDSRYPTKNL